VIFVTNPGRDMAELACALQGRKTGRDNAMPDARNVSGQRVLLADDHEELREAYAAAGWYWLAPAGYK
jgi:hypothetical protein